MDDRPASYRYQEILGPFARTTGDERVQKKLSEVLALLDFNSTLNRSLELREVLDLVLFVAMGETRASWAGVLKRDEDVLRPAARRGRNDSKWSSAEVGLPADAPEIAGVGDANVSPWARDVLTATGAALLVPLTKAERLIGVLLLGDRGEPYGGDERMFAEALCVSASASIDNGRIYEELQSMTRRLSLKVFQLNSLFDIARELNRITDVERVREVLLTSAMGHVLTTRAVVLQREGIVEGRGVNLSADDRASLERRGGELLTLPEDRSASELEPGPVRDVLQQHGFDTVVPLRSGELCHGVLLLGPRASGQSLASEDREFLRSLASQVAASLDNLRLTGEWIEKQKIEKEMALAREIQRGLLPEQDPTIDGWDISGINIPCLTVGGDYFDYVARGENKHWLVIADVSGKGTGAALLMASVHAALHALAGAGDISLDALADRLNEIVYGNTEINRYVTAFFSSFDAETGEMTFVNAGHCYPILLRSTGEVVRLSEGGPVIGLLADRSWTVGRVLVEKGDLLVFYTDGLSETANPEGEEFDDERILELLREVRSKPSREIMARLLTGVRAFAAEAGLADDLTLMVVQRT